MQKHPLGKIASPKQALTAPVGFRFSSSNTINPNGAHVPPMKASASFLLTLKDKKKANRSIFVEKILTYSVLLNAFRCGRGVEIMWERQLATGGGGGS